MSQAHPRPAQSRKPEVVHLPDGRVRYTRFYEMALGNQITPELFNQYAPGDLDDDVIYSGARFCYEKIGKGADAGGKSYLERIFEVLNETAETQIGRNTVIKLDDGRTGIEAEFWQFSDQAATPGTVGTTTAVGDTSAFMQKEVAENDGTLRRIKRTYVYAGILSTIDDHKNNGKLEIKTIISAKTAPATPSGYTLVTEKKDPVNGFPIYTYTFAKGDGEISRETEFRQSLDEGVAGATIVSILHLTAPGVGTNPIAAPSGMVKIQESRKEQDGYVLWGAIFASGIGLVLSTVDIRNGGKLIIYHRASLGAIPTEPSATIGGTVTLISSGSRRENGWEVFDYTWAEGLGEISNETEYRQSDDEGTTGATIITIGHLTDLATGSNPISTPAGTVLVAVARVEQDGYRRWTATYAKGAGLVLDESAQRSGGKLITYHRVALGAPPAAPDATIGGTVTQTGATDRHDNGYHIFDYTWAEGFGEISNETEYRQSDDEGTTGATIITIRHLSALATGTNPIATPASTVLVAVSKTEQDGYRLWSATYAKGAGLVLDESAIRNGGKLITYHRVALGAAPSAPAATIGGTVTLTASTDRADSGYHVFDYSWAEGIGEISRETEYRQSDDLGTTGATIISVRHLTAIATGANPIATPAGTALIAVSQTEQDGYRLWSATYAKGTGIVLDETDKAQQGKLVHYHLVKLGSAPSAPAATIAGTVVAVSTQRRKESGYDVYDYTWTEGVGLVAVSTRARNDGLREQTYVSLGTKQSPDGVAIADEQQDESGVTRYTVTCMQEKDGGATPTDATVETEVYVEFLFPGRAKPFIETFNDRRMMSVFLDPPIHALVKATKTISYQATKALGTISDLWNPLQWATVRAQWVGLRDDPVNKVDPYPGFRTVDDTPLDATAAGVAPNDLSIFGFLVFGATIARITVTGGPEDPAGNTYTIGEPITELAFVSITGTEYFRKTLLTATIPSQPALPI